MKIQDLEMRKELKADQLSAVRGGSNSISNGNLNAPVAVAGGFGFASPQTVVSTPVYAPTNVLQDNDTDVKVETNTAQILGSALTGVFQG